MTSFSVITPCRDSAAVVGDCLRSVRCQRQAVQHILVDADTDDATRRLAGTINPEAEILRQPPRGIYAALNRGLEAARGEVVGVLPADDFYAADDALSEVARVMEDPEIGACYGNLCYVDRHAPDKVVRFWRAGAYDPAQFRNGWMPPHPTFFLRRNLYERYGGYRTDLGTAADYELMLRVLLRHGVRAAYVPRVLVHMRTGGASNRSLRGRLAANRMDRAAWRVNGLKPAPWTLLAKPLRKAGQWWQRPEAAKP